MEEKKKAKPSLIETWEKHGIPCHYARFQTPIPPSLDVEPVSEFRINTKNKYAVDSITYTEYGVIWRAKGEVNICALANVMYSRSIIQSAQCSDNGKQES